MLWARMVAYVTGTVNQELLLRNEYLGAENRILRDQIKGRLLLSEGEKAEMLEVRILPGEPTPLSCGELRTF
jgi:putative transposase